MKLYRTYLIVNLKDSKLIDESNFTNIELILKPDPSNCYRESIDSKTQGIFISEDGQLDSNKIFQNELLIKAKDIESAENILSLIHGGLLLAYPEPSLATNLTRLTEYAEESEDLYKKDNYYPDFKKINNIGFGCVIANTVINNTSLIYAIEKYKISLEMFGINPHKVDPMHGNYFNSDERNYNYHTRAAFAIISAFSVIEELGLEIRSSKENPRFINDSGEWNPKVLSDINDRLMKIGIDSNSKFERTIRGSETQIEQNITHESSLDSEWIIFGKDIRDKILSFPQAIHNASYLRNSIAAHKFSDLIRFISPYDIFNIQLLARKLILKKINLDSN